MTDEASKADSPEAPDSPKGPPAYRNGPIARFLGVFGIAFPRSKGQWIVLTRRFRLLAALTVLLIVAVFGWFVFYYSGTSSFCNSCHIMNTYVDSWAGSAHKDIRCDKCHFPPGFRNVVRAKVAATTHLIKTLTGTAGPKPHAEVEDAACLRPGCHEQRLLKGKVVFKKDGRDYHFDHTSHLDPDKLRRGKKLRCTSCHSQIVQGLHITVTESACFTCHFTGKMHGTWADPVARCTGCHEVPAGKFKTKTGLMFDHGPFMARKVACWKCHADSVQGDGEVPKQVCLTCHAEPEKLEQRRNDVALHDWHVTKRKVECFSCHNEIRHGLHPEPDHPKHGCADCHASGHKLPSEMFDGKGARGVNDNPSRHSKANVDCVACHSTTNGPSLPDHATLTHKPTAEACVSCHGEGRRDTLTEWLEGTAELVADIDKAIAEAEKALAEVAADNPRRAEALQLLDDAKYNRDFVAKGHGVHNVDYAFDVTDAATAKAEEAAELARKIKAEGATTD